MCSRCLQSVIKGCGKGFNEHVTQNLLDLIFQALNHTNRFVRETGYQLCASLVGLGRQQGRKKSTFWNPHNFQVHEFLVWETIIFCLENILDILTINAVNLKENYFCLVYRMCHDTHTAQRLLSFRIHVFFLLKFLFVFLLIGLKDSSEYCKMNMFF